MHKEDESALLKMIGQKHIPKLLKDVYYRCQKRFHQIHSGPFPVTVLVLMCEMVEIGSDPSDEAAAIEAEPELISAAGQVNWTAQPANVLIRYGERTGKLISGRDFKDLRTLRVMFDDGVESWTIPADKCSLLGPLDAEDAGAKKMMDDNHPDVEITNGHRVTAFTKKHGNREGITQGLSSDGKIKVLFDGNNRPSRISYGNVTYLEPQAVK
jgi:hypothetical protein